MLTAVAVLASLAFIGWLIYQAVRQKPITVHTVCYVLASLTGVYTFAFFLDMDLPRLIKILLSILLGAVMIIIAAYLQQRRASKTKQS